MARFWLARSTEPGSGVAEHAPHNVMHVAGEIARFHDHDEDVHVLEAIEYT